MGEVERGRGGDGRLRKGAVIELMWPGGKLSKMCAERDIYIPKRFLSEALCKFECVERAWVTERVLGFWRTRAGRESGNGRFGGGGVGPAGAECRGDAERGGGGGSKSEG